MSQTPTRCVASYGPAGQEFSYHAASYARDRSVSAVTATQDYHQRWDRETLIAVQRGLDRENWLVEGAFNRATDYIIGPAGFTLQAKTGVDGVNARIEQEIWPEFTEDPEVRGTMSWLDCQNVGLRELFAAGDTLWLKIAGRAAGVHDGQLQHVEAERIADRQSATDDGKRIEQGVHLDALGRPFAFSVAATSSAGFVQTGDVRAVPVRDCVFVRGPFKRSSSSRGMPIGVSAMPLAHRLDDILTSEAIAWQTMSRLAFALNRESHGTGRAAVRQDTNAEARSTAATADLEKMVSEFGYAIMVQGKPGDELRPVQQSRPGANFEQSVKLFIRLYGIPLGIPMEIIALDFGRANYSQSRAIMLQAFLAFRRWQRRLVEQFYSRVYRWVIGRAVARDRLAWRPSLLTHVFNVPGWPWIDEDKEVSAWGKKIDRAIATQTQALASLGQDRDEYLENRTRELLDADRVAREIEEETQGRIPASEIWRHLAGLNEGKTAAANRVAGENTPPAPNAPDGDPDDE